MPRDRREQQPVLGDASSWIYDARPHGRASCELYFNALMPVEVERRIPLSQKS